MRSRVPCTYINYAYNRSSTHLNRGYCSCCSPCLLCWCCLLSLHCSACTHCLLCNICMLCSACFGCLLAFGMGKSCTPTSTAAIGHNGATYFMHLSPQRSVLGRQPSSSSGAASPPHPLLKFSVCDLVRRPPWLLKSHRPAPATNYGFMEST